MQGIPSVTNRVGETKTAAMMTGGTLTLKLIAISILTCERGFLSEL